MTAYFITLMTIIMFTILIKMIVKNAEKASKIAALIAYSLIIILVGVRHQSMGVDLGPWDGTGSGYLASFLRIGSCDWSHVLQMTSYQGTVKKSV